MLAFSTTKADVLPPDCDSLEVMRKDIDKKYIVTSGWDEMGNYYLKKKEHDQTDLTLNFVIDASLSQLSRVQSYLIKTTET